MHPSIMLIKVTKSCPKFRLVPYPTGFHLKMILNIFLLIIILVKENFSTTTFKLQCTATSTMFILYTDTHKIKAYLLYLLNAATGKKKICIFHFGVFKLQFSFSCVLTYSHIYSNYHLRSS